MKFDIKELSYKTKNKLAPVGLVLKKNSPYILTGIGVGAFFGALYSTHKAATQLETILAEAEEQKADILEHSQDYAFVQENNYTEDVVKKDLRIVKFRTYKSLAKLYSWPVFWSTITLGCMFGTNKIWSSRNATTMALYAATQQSYKKLYSKLEETLGEKEAFAFANGYEIKKTETVDENGNTITKEELIKNDENGVPSPYYPICFEKYTTDRFGRTVQNYLWHEGNNHLNHKYIQNVIAQCKRMIDDRGYLLLNDVRKMFNVQPTKEGALIGWIKGDEFSLGVFGDPESYLDFINNHDNGIILYPNAQTMVFDKMDEVFKTKKDK